VNRLLSAFCLLPSTFCLLAGCRGPDLVSPDFRARAKYVESLREELRQGDFGTLTRNRREDEQDGFRIAAYAQGEAPPRPRRLLLAPATPAFGADAHSSDASLRVLLEARNAEDRSIQLDGSLQVTAYEITPAGQKTLLETWDVSPAQLSAGWRADWSSAGYALSLPWKTVPAGEQVRVEARLVVADGTRCETGRDLTVRKAATSRQPAVPVWEPTRSSGKTYAASGTEGSEIRHVSHQAAGKEMEPTVRWEPTSLDGAIQLQRPVPLAPGE
jgi:hypothetical protein